MSVAYVALICLPTFRTKENPNHLAVDIPCCAAPQGGLQIFSSGTFLKDCNLVLATRKYLRMRGNDYFGVLKDILVMTFVRL